MGQFKRGDRVVCVKPTDYSHVGGNVQAGCEYTVAEFGRRQHGGYNSVELVEFPKITWFAHRFELARNPCYDSGWLGPQAAPEEPPQPAPFKMSGPGRYRSRDGKVFNVAEAGPGATWHFHGVSETGEYRGWKSDGTHYINHNEWDLCEKLDTAKAEPADPGLPRELQVSKHRQWWLNFYGEPYVYAYTTKDAAMAESKIQPADRAHVVDVSVLREILEMAEDYGRFDRLKQIRVICRQVLNG